MEDDKNKNVFNKLVSDLSILDIDLSEEDHVVILLNNFPKKFEPMIHTTKYDNLIGAGSQKEKKIYINKGELSLSTIFHLIIQYRAIVATYHYFLNFLLHDIFHFS